MKDGGFHFRDELSIVLSGEAGQGIQTVEVLLVKAFKRAGYNVFSTKEYMSRIRGGANSTQIRVGKGRVRSYSGRIDILIPLSKKAVTHLEERIDGNTLIIVDTELRPDGLERYEGQVHRVPFTRTANELGGTVYTNILATGLVASLLEVPPETLEELLRERFGGRGEDVLESNLEAGKRGTALGEEMRESGVVNVRIDRAPGTADEVLLSGAEVVSLGAIAGGCDFISSYPMSPSTGVLVQLSRMADRFGIIAEQAEDEIAAVNMTIGAWYAGARGMVTTSGGGLALMAEGISLAGMLDSPLVIHLAQRPGPATGLPTRTEQGDLELALYSGHGDFPRILLAPGDLGEAFELTREAFELADRYQVPVFVLTDQYTMDSYYNTEMFDVEGSVVRDHFQETTADYRRYVGGEDGICPRGIPGYGEGLVCVDSDTHDEEGHITENLEIREAAVNRRMRKLKSITERPVDPLLMGPDDYTTLVIGWGSTKNTIMEALERGGFEGVSFLHIKQLYPVDRRIGEYMARAKRTIIIENNATSQMARLLKLHLGRDTDRSILKYNGMPFSPEELVPRLREVI